MNILIFSGIGGTYLKEDLPERWPCIVRLLRERGHIVHNVGPNGECNDCYKDIFKVVERLQFEPSLILSVEDIFAENIDKWTKCPAAFWGMETMHHYIGHKIRGKLHNYCFINDLVRVEDFKSSGLKCELLPFAVSEKIWDYVAPIREYDLAYVGRLGYTDTDYYKERWDYFSLFQENPSWQGKVYYSAQQSDFRNYVKETSKGRIQWNFDSKDHLSERHWEGMALGCLVTNYVTGVEKILKNDYHAYFYMGKGDMLTKTKELIETGKWAEIWKNSRQNILENHTYKNRIKRILEVCCG